MFKERVHKQPLPTHNARTERFNTSNAQHPRLMQQTKHRQKQKPVAPVPREAITSCTSETKNLVIAGWQRPESTRLRATKVHNAHDFVVSQTRQNASHNGNDLDSRSSVYLQTNRDFKLRLRCFEEIRLPLHRYINFDDIFSRTPARTENSSTTSL